MFEIGREILLWVAIALNIASAMLSHYNFRRWRQKYEEYCELIARLNAIIEKENKLLLKLKEKQENELHG